ncbi:hypothetical protein SAMD00079811_03140 [Scytonema sp. HK-05]|nr:hypothetical protein SAMD00079811_03140 [Scytonema sp. HK-05]
MIFATVNPFKVRAANTVRLVGNHRTYRAVRMSITVPYCLHSKMAKTEATKSQHCRQNQLNRVWQVLPSFRRVFAVL